jgi:hypothetical protein
MNIINQNNRLSGKEIKLLKRTLWRQIFPSLTVTLFLFLILFVYSSTNNKFGLAFFSLILLFIIIGANIFLILTRKYILDLKSGLAKQEKEIVEDKICKLDYEPGSRSLPINLWSVVFIKKISQSEMKEMHICCIIVKGERIDIDQKDFERAKKGQELIIRRAPHSNLFLGVQTI